MLKVKELTLFPKIEQKRNTAHMSSEKIYKHIREGSDNASDMMKSVETIFFLVTKTYD